MPGDTQSLVPGSKTATTPKLFQPVQVGEIQLAHRVVLPPLARYRADTEGVPTDLNVTYYTQRGSTPGTLLISEASVVSPYGGGGPYIPGAFNDTQVAGWKKVVDSVHAKGSYFFIQLWAGGRASSASTLADPDVTDLHAPSAIPKPGGKTPREMSISDIKEYVKVFTQAAVNAVKGAGCDGVELHAANGYLIHQFIDDGSNVRTDEYGGSIENRARFLFELVAAVSKAVGIKKTAVRLSPWTTFNGVGMKDPIPTFSYIVKRLVAEYPDLAYLHLIEPGVHGYLDGDHLTDSDSNDFLRDIWLPRALITSGGYYRKEGIAQSEKTGELIGFGRLFISNPDLPIRLRDDLPLQKWLRDFYYVPNEPHGYIDYPFAGEGAYEGGYI